MQEENLLWVPRQRQKELQPSRSWRTRTHFTKMSYPQQVGKRKLFGFCNSKPHPCLVPASAPSFSPIPHPFGSCEEQGLLPVLDSCSVGWWKRQEREKVVQPLCKCPYLYFLQVWLIKAECLVNQIVQNAVGCSHAPKQKSLMVRASSTQAEPWLRTGPVQDRAHSSFSAAIENVPTPQQCMVLAAHYKFVMWGKHTVTLFTFCFTLLPYMTQSDPLL